LRLSHLHILCAIQRNSHFWHPVGESGKFFDHLLIHFFWFQGEYSVLQLVSLFYNIVILLFFERIRHLGKFYITNSADCFPCLTTTSGILASFWALVLAVSLVNARAIFIQTGLFFLFSFVQTICLLISSCLKQIQVSLFGV
jgi:hypothetical protein